MRKHNIGLYKIIVEVYFEQQYIPILGQLGDMNMDYSAYYPPILFMYFGTFVGVIVAMALLICGAMHVFKLYQKSKSNIMLIGFTVCIVIVIVISYFAQSFFRDIPFVVNKNYIITIGIAQGWDTAGQEPETRGFAFKRDNGEIIDITVTYTPIHQGDRFEVIYLPHTKFGAIVRKIEDSNEVK